MVQKRGILRFPGGDATENRTRDTTVKGWCLNRLTMAPYRRKTGDVLISQGVAPQVSSALKSLTSVFGMGTGVSSSLLSPDFHYFEGLYPQN